MNDPILVIGSGNAEYILRTDKAVELGQKHTVNIEELYGGSAVNYTLRLLSAGYEVMPIITIGNDRLGRNIQDSILNTAIRNEISAMTRDFIKPKNPDLFFDENIVTPSSSIVVHGAQRTIFGQKLAGGNHFIRHLETRLNDIKILSHRNPSAVMIGHIFCDCIAARKSISEENAATNNGKCVAARRGECTDYVINTYKNKTLIYCNFGRTQIQFGYSFWKSLLQYVSIVQLNLNEARRFFSTEENSKLTLVDIVDKLRNEGITAIITLNRFGAIGVYSGRKDCILLAWPLIETKDIVDPTGAGDAFAAGMISHLAGKKDFSFGEFLAAMEVARTWSAYACTKVGASKDCPNNHQLEAFRSALPKGDSKPVELKYTAFTKELISLFDIAYQ